MNGKTDSLIYDRINDGRYYKAMIHDSPVAMLIVDPSGKFLDANQAAVKFLGYSIGQLTSMCFQQITHPDDMIASMEMVNLLINGKQETFELTKRYMTKVGNVWALVRVNAIRDEHGKLECYISHIIPVLGCTDDVMRDVLGRITKQSDGIIIGRKTLFVIIFITILTNILMHVFFHQ